MRSRPVALFSLGLTATALAVAIAHHSFAGEKPALTRDWREVGKNHWQVVSPPGEDPGITDRAEGNRGACTPGMVEVRGKMRVSPIGDELQKTACTKWINKEFPERCASFDRGKWQAIKEKLPQKAMHYCIDRFEYPNRKNESPIIFVNFPDAEGLCKKENKRLCTEDEWTFACEGEDATPYPYGYDRDKEACAVDRPYRLFDGKAYGRKATLIAELDRLWQGVPSGSQPKCRSPFGVYDMIGNVDEWTLSSIQGRRSILKGGYWGPVRTRCRPSTRAHGEEHAFYQQGLRCCSDAPSGAGATTTTPR